MKEKIFIVIAVMIFAVLVYAQSRQEMEKPNADMMLEHLTKDLKLSKDQQDNIKPLLEKQIELMDEFHAQKQSNDNSGRQQFREENDKLVIQIKAFLSEEQQIEYDKMRENMQKNHGNGPRRRN